MDFYLVKLYKFCEEIRKREATPIWDTKLEHWKGSGIVDHPSACVCAGLLLGGVWW